MLKRNTQILTVAAAVAALAGFASTTFAQASTGDTTWQKNHPRREQVNNRLNHQNARIRSDVKDGTLTRGQAAQLHRQDHQVRQEERDMAAQNGGHITKSEQKVLNQQENGISREIPPK